MNHVGERAFWRSLSRTPLTKAGEPAEPNRRASSMASSNATCAGVSGVKSSSYCAETQHVAIHNRHARDWPVGGGGAEAFIEAGPVLFNAVEEGETEGNEGIVAQPVADELLDGLADHVGIEIALEEQSEGHFPVRERRVIMQT